jgi:hypothetical protein
MQYELLNTTEKEDDFFFASDSTDERFGRLGYLRADFGKNGDEFFTTWFDRQGRLKTAEFRTEFDEIINFLRDNHLLESRKHMKRFCSENPDKKITDYSGFKIQTEGYSYYFRCNPGNGDYELYCFVYDNRYALPELAGEHEMPNDCYSVKPSTGEVVFIVYGEGGYYPCGKSTPDRETNRQISTAQNALLGVTRAQEKAMLAGSMLGWEVPAAKVWNYNQDGSPRIFPQKEKCRNER